MLEEVASARTFAQEKGRSVHETFGFQSATLDRLASMAAGVCSLCWSDQRQNGRTLERWRAGLDKCDWCGDPLEGEPRRFCDDVCADAREADTAEVIARMVSRSP